MSWNSDLYSVSLCLICKPLKIAEWFRKRKQELSRKVDVDAMKVNWFLHFIFLYNTWHILFYRYGMITVKHTKRINFWERSILRDIRIVFQHQVTSNWLQVNTSSSTSGTAWHYILPCLYTGPWDVMWCNKTFQMIQWTVVHVQCCVRQGDKEVFPHNCQYYVPLTLQCWCLDFPLPHTPWPSGYIETAFRWYYLHLQVSC